MLNAAIAAALFNLIYDYLLSQRVKWYSMLPWVDLMNHCGTVEVRSAGQTPTQSKKQSPNVLSQRVKWYSMLPWVDLMSHCGIVARGHDGWVGVCNPPAHLALASSTCSDCILQLQSCRQAPCAPVGHMAQGRG